MSEAFMTEARDFFTIKEKSYKEKIEVLENNMKELEKEVKRYTQTKTMYHDEFNHLIEFINKIQMEDIMSDLVEADLNDMKILSKSTNEDAICRLAFLKKNGNNMDYDFVKDEIEYIKDQYGRFIGNRFCINYIAMVQTFYN